MKTTEWDKVLSSSPLNKQAAMGSTINQETDRVSRNAHTEEWKAPPPTRSLSYAELNQDDFVDLTGVMRGKLVVIGILRASEKVRWVCRCACGTYVVRRAKAIKNTANTLDCCTECRHLNDVRRFDSAEQRAARKARGLSY